tara:strand:- start:1119 stop:1346 length:228 start_codon:yes stop_codon:yes gene_type:complete
MKKNGDGSGMRKSLMVSGVYTFWFWNWKSSFAEVVVCDVEDDDDDDDDDDDARIVIARKHIRSPIRIIGDARSVR